MSNDKSQLPAKARSNWRRTTLINVLVFFGLLAALEIAARIYVAWTRGSQTAGMQERTVYLSYKPYVMYGPDWDQSLAPAQLPRRKGVCRVLMVGGSTAAGFPGLPLEQGLSARFPGQAFEIINAAQGGYEARQEVVVAALWGPAIEPDVLLSLDGANDLEHRLRVRKPGEFYLSSTYELFLTRPFIAPLGYLLAQSQLYNGMVRLSQRGRLGPPDQYADAIPVYVQAQRSLNVLAKGMGSLRLMVLQPFSAFKTPLSSEEAAFGLYTYREEMEKALYSRTHEQLATLSAHDGVAYLDARFIYQNVPERIFTDDVHLTPEGYSRLAEAIASALADAARAKPDVCRVTNAAGHALQ